jgi:predicted DNA-binding protein
MDFDQAVQAAQDSQNNSKKTSSTPSTFKPDEETKNRIKNLAYVGTALVQISNEIAGETDYFLAKDALRRFEEGINKLELDYQSRKGMRDLTEYLKKKLDKRIKQLNNDTVGY